MKRYRVIIRDARGFTYTLWVTAPTETDASMIAEQHPLAARVESVEEETTG